MKPARVLIVDDSSVMRKIVGRSLRQAGLEVEKLHEASLRSLGTQAVAQAWAQREGLGIARMIVRHFSTGCRGRACPTLDGGVARRLGDSKPAPYNNVRKA
jgi:CheY-like chemotaxis protein